MFKQAGVASNLGRIFRSVGEGAVQLGADAGRTGMNVAKGLGVKSIGSGAKGMTKSIPGAITRTAWYARKHPKTMALGALGSGAALYGWNAGRHPAYTVDHYHKYR